ncbi:MAG: glycerophosphodiester phosphodiesterase family protein [Opitutae bacterium]|jgi:glycerophosphoryl diester phosphodiesterase|nr:glycerophosphodiester phosphodiesterase family protein [Opitutae bacterium]MDG1301372.1 glycerophosphodiester phosphodiesterase family protein [Opitutae bacterium]
MKGTLLYSGSKILKPFALAGVMLLVWLLTDRAFLHHITSLSEVMETHIGRSAESLPDYPCTVGAHRGSSINFLENSYSALLAADQDPKYAFIEFDVQYTKDGQIVVFHDKRLLRLFGKFATIKNSTYAELMEASDGQIARYQDIVDAVNKKLNIEIKSQGDHEEDCRLADVIIQDIQARGREKDIMISSISSDVIRYIGETHPSVPTGQIYWLASSTYLHFDLLTKRLYQEFNESNADYLMLHVANLRNIEGLLALKPEGKTIIFWDFDDHMYLVREDYHDRLWGTSVIGDLWQKFIYRFT